MELGKKLKDVLEHNRKLRIAIEELATAELKKNFAEGGRFGEGLFGGGMNKWKPSKRAIKQAGRTLIDTGNLMNSVGAKVDVEQNELELYSYNVPYAEKHQYGDAKENLPARPFLTLPDDFVDAVVDAFVRVTNDNDWEEIKDELISVLNSEVK